MTMPREICESILQEYKQSVPQLQDCPSGIDTPPDSEMGDLSIALAMRASGILGRNPRDIGEEIAEEFKKEPSIDQVRVDGPGFVNIRFSDQYLLENLMEILDRGEMDYPNVGQRERVLLEFVSANPTGPLHVGHGRGAIYGDVLARLMTLHGYEVDREYYVNDAGRQIEKLGESIQLRAKQLEGQQVELGEDHYRGDYLLELVRNNNLSSDQSVQELARVGEETILNQIFTVLKRSNIEFANVTKESDVATENRLHDLIDRLQAQNLIYEEEGAVFLQSTAAGDDKDRVLIRSNGDPTYFANDLVYHHEKYQRGYLRLIDIWGHDHHGYQQRLRSGLEFLGHDTNSLEIELYQLVNLFREGQPVSMSTRGGEFVTLDELIDEVGVDAVRFNFMTRNHNRPLDFDIDIALSESEENPVYYVQYAHTRISSILRKAPEELLGANWKADELSVEGHHLVFRALELPWITEQAMRDREPHQITYYLQDLASQFHTYYAHNRVIDEDDPEQSARRLTVIQFLKNTLADGLAVLGVSAPDRM